MHSIAQTTVAPNNLNIMLFVGMSVCNNLQKDHLKIKLKITGISGIQVS